MQVASITVTTAPYGTNTVSSPPHQNLKNKNNSRTPALIIHTPRTRRPITRPTRTRRPIITIRRTRRTQTVPPRTPHPTKRTRPGGTSHPRTVRTTPSHSQGRTAYAQGRTAYSQGRTADAPTSVGVYYVQRGRWLADQVWVLLACLLVSFEVGVGGKGAIAPRALESFDAVVGVFVAYGEGCEYMRDLKRNTRCGRGLRRGR